MIEILVKLWSFSCCTKVGKRFLIQGELCPPPPKPREPADFFFQPNFPLDLYLEN